MKKIFGDPVVRFFVSVLGLFVICFVLMELQHIFIPLVIAYILFFFFEPLNQFLKSKKIPLLFIIFIDLFLTSSILYGISRVLIDRFIQFSAQLPLYESRLNHIISETALSLGFRDRLLTHFSVTRLLKSINFNLISSGVLSSTLSVVVSILLVLFFFIFISSGHHKIVEAIRMRYVEKGIKSSLKKMKKEKSSSDDESSAEQKTEEETAETLTFQREIKLQRTFKDITEQIQRYIVTKFLISLSMGILFGLILWLFGVQFFIIWASLALLLNFIPNVGSVIAVILPSLMALIQYQSFGYASIVAGVLIILQNIIGNLIEPKIFGDQLGLNPLVILLSLLLWGYLWGIVGMFLSVPLTAVIKIILSNSNSKNMHFITNLMSN
ncbi:MAG: AI-2E family transporter [Bacteroidetes bacterium]|nr:AI-2E family transporter [Bacteroidota bacterium]